MNNIDCGSCPYSQCRIPPAPNSSVLTELLHSQPICRPIIAVFATVPSLNLMTARFLTALAVALAAFSAVAANAQTGTALIRHPPALNGTIDGSVQQMSAESASLNGNAAITGTLSVPGTPSTRLNGHSTFGGTIMGTGVATPANYTITLNGNARLGSLRTCTDAVALPSVPVPAQPAGTRSVTLNRASDPIGDFATLRNLALNGNVGQVTVPAGTYGDFTANGNGGFTLGVAGATQPSIYAFQHLTLNGNSMFHVAGPVVVTVASAVSVNGSLGDTSHPEWLVLRLAAGDFTLNGNVVVSAYVSTPNGAITINGNSQLIGGATADRLTVNGNSLLRLIDLSPTVSVTAPLSGTVATAPIGSIAITASASDADGYITKVEFFTGTTKLGESVAPAYQFTWTVIPAGTYSLTAKATDNCGVATTSAPVVLIANQPPAVSLTGPVAGAVVSAPATLTIAANASDPDGTVANVEFFQNGAKIGESSTAPYQVTASGLGAGSYTFSAKATDNYGATAMSVTRSVIVDVPPTAAVVAPASVSRGAGVTLNASATDTDGSIAKVEFYRGEILIGTVTSATGTPPAYTFTDAAALAPGAYSYTVRSYDNLGLFTDSTSTVVTVVATLPYTADFEAAEAYALGPLNGQLGWTATSAAATVTGDAAYNGAQSIALAPGTPPVRVAQTFAPYPNHDVVFLDFFARPVAESDITNSTTFDVEAARFAFLQNGSSAVLNVFNGDGNGGGAWQPTKFSVPIGSDNQVQSWTRLAARLDFVNKTWDLYAGGNMIAADVAFRDSNATNLSSFAIRGDAATMSRLDYIFAGGDNPLFADANNNGIDDAWETAHGLSLTTNNRKLAPSGNGVTVVTSYINGTDPNDYYQGVAPVLTSLVAANGQLDSTGLVSVRVNNSSGATLSNAPVTFTVGGTAQITDAAGGALGSVVSVRTDSQGVARCYLSFNSATSATVTAAAHYGTQSTALAISVASAVVDSDGNGLPDDWEIKYFGYVGVDPNADPDGDGLTNLQEFKNGTDPTDYYNGVLPVVTSNVPPSGDLAADSSISVTVKNAAGQPLVNAPVKFRAKIGGHQLALSPGDPPTDEIVAHTDANGIAKAFVIGGSN